MIYVDGKIMKSSTESPYYYNWNTKPTSTGMHSITAEAYDSNGNIAQESISVEILENLKGKPSEVKKSGISEISDFENGVVLLYSSSTAGEIIRAKIAAFDGGDVTNLGLSVSDVAKLHKLLAHATKEERDDFKILFQEYKRIVKNFLNIGQGIDLSTLQDFSKKSMKLELTVAKLEEKDQRDQKIKSTIEISKENKKLQKIRNEIGRLQNDLSISSDKKEKLQDLYEKQKDTLKNLLMINAELEGKTLSESDLQEIEDKIEKQNNSNQENDGDKNGNNAVNGKNGNSEKGNDENSEKSNDDKGNSDKGNSDKGNSDKGNSDKGNSDKGNSDKGNSDKGKSNKGNNGKSKNKK